MYNAGYVHVDANVVCEEKTLVQICWRIKKPKPSASLGHVGTSSVGGGASEVNKDGMLGHVGISSVGGGASEVSKDGSCANFFPNSRCFMSHYLMHIVHKIFTIPACMLVRHKIAHDPSTYGRMWFNLPWVPTTIHHLCGQDFSIRHGGWNPHLGIVNPTMYQDNQDVNPVRGGRKLSAHIWGGKVNT